MRRLSRRTLLAWAGLGALAPSCISPTLPLPPPDVPNARNLGNGQYLLQGTLPVLGTVVVQNLRTQQGQLRGEVVAYELTLAAEKGDNVALWYEVDGDLSSTVVFQIDRLSPILNDGGAP